MNLKSIWQLLKETVTGWNKDKVSRLAAALAYYTVFSLAPLLIIAIAIAGSIFGEAAARGQIVGQIQGLVGKDGAQFIQTAIQSAHKPNEGAIASIVSFVILMFGASGVFAQLQDSLNTIWEVQPKPDRALLVVLRDRFFSFAMVLAIGFLLLVSLVLTAGLTAAVHFLGSLVPGFDFVWQILNFVVSFATITLLFGLIYKVLPDVTISWSDVWIGASLTSLLFTIGKLLLGLYLGQGSFGSTYGAAGSLVIILTWVYYSAQILFLGAEFTKVYARKYGSRIVPNEHAMPLTTEARAEQGMNGNTQRRSLKRKPASNFFSRIWRRLTKSKRPPSRSNTRKS